MADVLIGQAYFLRFDPKLWEAQQPYPPLGALYAAAAVRADGRAVAVFDAMLAQDESEWSDALDRHRPTVAVLYEDSFNYLSKMCLLRMRDAALVMIDAAVARGVTVLISGSDPSDHPSVYLDRGARAVVRGEGEATLVAAVSRLLEAPNESLERVPGLVVRGADGVTRETGARPALQDLDALPRPAWDLIDIDRYAQIWRRRHGRFSMHIVTTRGCPYRCNWCAKPIYGRRYTVRSAERVADDIAYLRTTWAVDHLWIADDIFGLKPGWVEAFAAALQVRGIRLPFRCLVRADQITPRFARSLAASGCETAWIGAESGSQRVLDAMDKGITVAQITGATRHLRASGIAVGFFLQFGYPGESRDDVDLTRAMVREAAPDDIGVSVSYPLPGTPFFERVKADLGVRQNWIDSDDMAVLYKATYPEAFYRDLHQLVHAEHRARRAGAVLSRMVQAGRVCTSGAAVAGVQWLRYTVASWIHRARLDTHRPNAHPTVAAVTLPVLTARPPALRAEAGR